VFAAALWGAACGKQAAVEAPAPAAAPAPWVYPAAPRGAAVDDYFGTAVPDPYRWLEDPESPETRAWIEAENALTRSYLDAVPSRPSTHQRLTELWNYERYGLPSKEAGRYFFERNDGLQQQSVLYVADALDAAPRVLLRIETRAGHGAGKATAARIDEAADTLSFLVRALDIQPAASPPQQ
jgi:prolyl oligopeptidase